MKNDKDSLLPRVAVGVAAALVLGMLLGLSVQGPLQAQTETTTRRSTRGSPKKTESSHAKIERKTRQILDNQQQILQKFDALLEEIHTVKIRVSR